MASDAWSVPGSAVIPRRSVAPTRCDVPPHGRPERDRVTLAATMSPRYPLWHGRDGGDPRRVPDGVREGTAHRGRRGLHPARPDHAPLHRLDVRPGDHGGGAGRAGRGNRDARAGVRGYRVAGGQPDRRDGLGRRAPLGGPVPGHRIYPQRGQSGRHLRHRHRPVGHRGAEDGPARLRPAGRPGQPPRAHLPPPLGHPHPAGTPSATPSGRAGPRKATPTSPESWAARGSSPASSIPFPGSRASTARSLPWRSPSPSR